LQENSGKKALLVGRYVGVSNELEWILEGMVYRVKHSGGFVLGEIIRSLLKHRRKAKIVDE